nr:MAG: movement protein, coat protein [Broad bean wilt virus 1]
MPIWLLWTLFASVVVVILKLEYTYIVKPFLRTVFYNTLSHYSSEYLRVHSGICWNHTFAEYWEHTIFFRTPISYCEPGSGVKHTLSELIEMEEDRVNVTGSHTIPKEVLLERAKNYRLAQESNKSLLPRVEELYEVSKWKRSLSAFNRGEPTFVRTSEMVVGSMSGSGHMKVKVPVVKTFEEEAADTRISDKARSKANQIVVAAVEIVNDGFASVNSDVTLAAALYDKRHKTITSSFKGAYASRASGVPSHVVFYPTHRVPGTDNPNETLELSAVSRDSDFDENFTLANFSVRTVYARAKGPEAIRETQYLLNSKNEDLMKAQQFASDEQVVLALPRMYPQVNLDNYVMPGPSSITRSEGEYSQTGIKFRKPIFKGSEIILNATSKPFVRKMTSGLGDDQNVGCLSDDDGMDYKYGQALMEENVLDAQVNLFPLHGTPETMRLLFSGIATIPMNVTAGTKITVAYLNELASHPGVHTQLLNMLGKIPGTIKVRVHCEVAPTSGIGLAITYVEGNESAQLGTNLGRLLGIQHYKWNPAIEPVVEFCFKPFSCTDWWNMHYLGTSKYSPVLALVCLSKWNNAPKGESKLSYAMYFEPDITLPKQIATPFDVPSFMLRKELGTLEFKQGERKAYMFEVNFGKPQVEGKNVTLNFASAYCGLSQYMDADVLIDLTLMSSPMMGGTFTIAYVAGSYLKSIKNMQFLDALPHITFTFEKGGKSTRSLRFPGNLFPTSQSLDRWDLDASREDDVSGHFVLYQRDTVSSALEGSMVFRVAARVSGNPVMRGVSVGYPTTTTRVTMGKLSTRDLIPGPSKPIGVAKGQAHLNPLDFTNAYYPMGEWNYNSSEHKGRREDRDIVKHFLKMRLDGTKATEDFKIIHSPLVRILQNCAWFKGTIHFKVMVKANSGFMSYQRTSQVHVTAHENSLSSNEFFSEMVGPISGEVYFSREVVGPVDGFASMGWNVQGTKKFYKLCISLGNVHEYDAVKLSARFGSDVEFAGQQKAGHYMLDKEVSVFKDFKY